MTYRREDVLPLVKNYLKCCRDLRTNPQVSELAHQARTTRQRLHADFLKEVGIPLGTYLHNVQMDYARRLLRSGLTVAEVSEHVGMTESAFRKAYKRRFGQPPGAHRR